jgi:rhomboid protease GluP
MINTKTVLLQKFKLIFVPFLITAIGYLLVYTFLHWLLFIKLQLFTVKDDYLNLWAPFVLPWIAILTWLNKRIKLLRLKKGRKNATTGYQMAAAFAIAAPIIIAQLYLETASGKLTQLTRVEDITGKSASKFYTFSSYYIDTANKGIAFTSDVSGKYNSHLNFHIYITCPIYDADLKPTKIGGLESTHKPVQKKEHRGILYLLDNYKIDSTKMVNFPADSIASEEVLKGVPAIAIFGNDGLDGVVMIRTKRAVRNNYGQFLTDNLPRPKAWCCFKYSKQISNSKTSDEKEEEYHSFYDLSKNEFEHTYMYDFTYFERVGYNDEFLGYQKAIRKTNLVTDSAIRNILEPRYNNYLDRNGNKLGWIFGSLAIGSVIWFALLLIYPFDEEKLRNFLAGNSIKEESDYKDLIGVFKPKPGYLVTPLLVDLNILIFLLMAISGLGFVSFNTNELLHWGANYRSGILNGQWWRLLTSIFLHSGIYHLLANMAALFFVGTFLEPRLGTVRMTICYIVTGFCASLASIWWYGATVSVGASGAIFGLYGIFICLMLTGVFPKEYSKIFLLVMIVFVGVNLFVGINGGIDNAAHIGGLLSGMLIGLMITPGMLSEFSKEETTED